MKNTLRALRYFFTSPCYFLSQNTRIGARVSDFFYELRPSVRAERHRVDQQGDGCYSYGYPSSGDER